MSFSNESNIIFQLLILSSKKHLNQKDIIDLNKLVLEVKNWNIFFEVFYINGIAPLFYLKIKFLNESSCIPNVVINKFRKSYYNNLNRNIYVYQVYHELCLIFNKNHIDFIPLKGIYLAEWLYTDVALRQMSDIDILVKVENAEKIFNLLFSNYHVDYQYNLSINNINHHHYLPYNINGINVEFHKNLQNEKYNNIQNIDELWVNSKIIENELFKYSALNIHDVIIHLILHSYRNFKNYKIHYLGFVDIANIFLIYKDEINWDLLITKCKKLNAIYIYFYVLILINQFFNINLPVGYLINYKSVVTKYDKLKFKSLVLYRNQNINLRKLIIEELTFFEKISIIYSRFIPKKLIIINSYSVKYPIICHFYYPYHWWIEIKSFLQMVMKIRR